MIYKVQARFKPETAAEFHRKLSDGTIENQQPDGREIVSSMQRATVGDDGIVRWSETCYCPTPLLHERETVYDQHFSEFETEEIDNYAEFEGRPFLEIVKKKVEA